MAGVRPVTVVLDPVPAIAPGLSVHAPAGNPCKATLPVAKLQVGCVIVPTVGDESIGWALITIFNEADEVHKDSFVTVYVYVPVASADIVVVVPEPVVVVPPGDLVNVQFPVGKLFNSTLPVDTEQVGCVMVPTVGAVGVTGCALMTTFDEDAETQVAAFVTV